MAANSPDNPSGGHDQNQMDRGALDPRSTDIGPVTLRDGTQISEAENRRRKDAFRVSAYAENHHLETDRTIFDAGANVVDTRQVLENITVGGAPDVVDEPGHGLGAEPGGQFSDFIAAAGAAQWPVDGATERGGDRVAAMARQQAAVAAAQRARAAQSATAVYTGGGAGRGSVNFNAAEHAAYQEAGYSASEMRWLAQRRAAVPLMSTATYTPLGDYAGQTMVPATPDAPPMRYVEQMGHVKQVFVDGVAKGVVNGVPKMVMEAGRFLWQAASYQSASELGAPTEQALEIARRSTDDVWDGTVFAYRNPDQRLGGLLGELASPWGYGKAVKLTGAATSYVTETGLWTRAFGGRGGTIGGERIGNAEVGAGSAATTLSRIEGRFANAGREVGFVVDSDSGAILTTARQPYGQARASFRFSDEQWAMAEGNWITHNHPSGNTLGVEDLAGAVASGARGIRASTSSGVYELAFDSSFASGYRGSKLGAAGFLAAETNGIGAGIMADVRSGALVVPGDLTGSARNGFLANEMWTRYANQTPGLRYTFTAR